MRAKRTRTLIQIGGLAEKFGLLKAAGLTLGQDLQSEPATFSTACVLAAVFEQAAESLNNDPQGDKFERLKERGRELLVDGVSHALRGGVDRNSS